MTDVAGIILAAGLSSRFPGNKLLVTFSGETLVHRAARTALASRLERVVLVAGHQIADMIEALSDLRCDDRLCIVVNPVFQEGQSGSIRRGLAALEDSCQAALFMTADQPLLSSDIIDALLAHYEVCHLPVCHPTVAGERRNPIVFARSLFADLNALSGDQGGRSVVDAQGGRIAKLEFHDSRPFLDVDTIDDLRALDRGAC
jgi:molybdenum cofactor cytidylyltransferase